MNFNNKNYYLSHLIPFIATVMFKYIKVYVMIIFIAIRDISGTIGEI